MSNYGSRSHMKQQHDFAHSPAPTIQRSSFNRSKSHKSTYAAGLLYPFYVDEVLPGDTFNVSVTAFTRLASLAFPVMDDMFIDFHYFFVPNRLVWDNWQKFMGEQVDPDDSTDFLIPVLDSMDSPTNDAWLTGNGSLLDHLGIHSATSTFLRKENKVSALWVRAYCKIWNEWFRDQNLMDSIPVSLGDGPDFYQPIFGDSGNVYSSYGILARSKRHDYFTSCLPWPQKGDAITLPIGDKAYLKQDRSPTNAATADHIFLDSVINPTTFDRVVLDDNNAASYIYKQSGDLAPTYFWSGDTGGGVTGVQYLGFDGQQTYADLSAATGNTINAIRLAFQQQKFMERDARGGTRYIEIIKSHFGIDSPDARLQRTEYLGGHSQALSVTPVPQTTYNDRANDSEPSYNENVLGALASTSHAAIEGHKNGFVKSFTEHGMVFGLVSYRANVTYQEGVHRRFTRQTRFDYYWPEFAHLGEQAVLAKELYFVAGTATESANDTVFGYQERWAEYRYANSTISGFFRSKAYGQNGSEGLVLDSWHFGQNFAAAPILNSTFMREAPAISRALAFNPPNADPETANIWPVTFVFDSKISAHCARPMPTYSVPGQIDRF